MKIFLIGFMGCGKTTMGKKLAAKLDCPFFDLDHQIEAEMGQTIATYFTEHGEAAFRQLENKKIKAFSYPKHAVIATGGGTPCYFDNIDWMNENGLTIYINMPAQALAKRLEKGKAKRPLLHGLDTEGLISFIEQKLKDRNPFYRQAKLIVSGIGLNAETLKEQINAQQLL
ncbi:MAG: shikimate kinase [Pedobacter sp.]|nr:MAG: shikimate kinase [Pedobacter sp.]